jgi:hypothetical protein
MATSAITTLIALLRPVYRLAVAGPLFIIFESAIYALSRRHCHELMHGALFVFKFMRSGFLFCAGRWKLVPARVARYRKTTFFLPSLRCVQMGARRLRANFTSSGRILHPFDGVCLIDIKYLRTQPCIKPTIIFLHKLIK